MEDFWKKYDLLCSELEIAGKREMVGQLRDAQKYVNGLTDGWYDFLSAFESATISNELDGQTGQLVQVLIATLKARLENR